MIQVRDIARQMLKVILGVCALMLSACFPEWHSIAHINPQPDWKAERAGEATRFIGPDIAISITTSNIHWWTGGTPGERHLRITLWFDPKRPGITFDPSNTTLILDASNKMLPFQVQAKWTGNAYSWSGCGMYPILARESEYMLRRGLCFELDFDVEPPNPDRVFRLHISGLNLEGEQLEVPEFYFKEGKTWRLPLPGP